MNAGIIAQTQTPPGMPYGISVRSNRPIPMPVQFLHAEAVDWETRVISAGGVVSGATLTAVSEFCRRIESLGLRDRFFRLNLFCGSNIAAALTPLYRSRSQTGTTVGFARDVNGNFVSGDYVETGPSGGLTGNGSTKYLEPGVTAGTLVNVFPSVHLAGYFTTRPSSGNFLYQDASDQPFALLGDWSLGSNVARHSVGVKINDAPDDTLAARPGIRIVSRVSASELFIMRTNNATITDTNFASVSSWSSFTGAQINLWRRQVQNNAHDGYSNVRCCGYSIGVSLSRAQATSYMEVMEAFQVAMGRRA